MEITSAKFVISNSRADMCPEGNLPEYAFIGRSNVGKSSLINMLTNHSKLAMTSSTPGKTLLINHFLINNSWYLVDLPGYGYAQRGKKVMEQIKNIIQHYVLERMQMTCLFVLIDSRLEPQKIDLQFIEWLGENSVPFALVFTKADKQNIVKTQTCIYQSRQAKHRKNPTKCRTVSEYTERTMGRASGLFHHFCRKKDGKKRGARLH